MLLIVSCNSGSEKSGLVKTDENGETKERTGELRDCFF